MLFTKSAVVFSVLALCNVVVAAQPPACLLSVVGDEPNPADLKTICVKNGDKMQKLISKKCDDDDKKDALSHFSDTCSSNGYKVDVSTSTTMSGSTTTGSQSTKTGFTTATATSGSSSSFSSASSSSDSASSSASADTTVSAGASDRHVSAAAFAAVVFVGFAATM
ncbi:putative GPI anchored cell wall protein [Aspergillus glaucus CBS 516.65]|uniref:Extracellular membrane protein CFEM domain-containing protein n=1 Tax=Aspergillus glaucus CBS 516.65 TaxID=1160497 RepID=A0A1L9VT64_ASPGL|nr:hypothetical protein ASPGLDRAFT_1128900 [Aspergillus glaucus CBS 516.65]OJJ87111.1 hypothetical protein ASPGLDRAFT_1128900 [Aspergillus glaucus CBS 516.65]